MSYYGIQKPRSKSALAEIFNIAILLHPSPSGLPDTERKKARERVDTLLQLSHVGLLKVELSERSLLREQKEKEKAERAREEL